MNREDLNRELVEATKYDLPLVKDLLDMGANPNAIVIRKDGSAMTAMTMASKMGDIKMIKLLLHYGGDVNFGGDGTPLTWAFRHPLVQEILLENGADPYKVDNHGLTFMDYQKEYENSGTFESCSIM